MHIRIRAPTKLSIDEIDLGKLEFPKQWLHAPKSSGNTPPQHVCAQQGSKWCGDNGIDATSDCQYRFDRAVWTVTIIDTLLFDCELGRIAISFIQESADEEYAIIDMSSKLLLDLRAIVKEYAHLPEEPNAIRGMHQAMLSFCIDIYSSFVLHQLKLMNVLPANYFIWITQMKRKEVAQDVCMAAKELAEVLYNLSGDDTKSELSAWVEKCIQEPLSDALDFLLAHNSRQISPTCPSTPDTSFETSSDGSPTTPLKSSSSSDVSSNDSPTPVGDIDVWEQYRDRFNLTADVLRHVDRERMARLLPPRLSQGGLNMDFYAKIEVCKLETRIEAGMNRVRFFEKLIEDEIVKEKERIEEYMPDALTSGTMDDSSDEEMSEKSYNLRARSSSPHINRIGKKTNTLKQALRGCSSPRPRGKHGKSKSKKKKKIKTAEEYDEEWKKREDSPYPRRHSEIIVGKSASEMMRFNLPIRKKNFGFPGAKVKKTSPAKIAAKRKLDTIQEDEDFTVHKKLKAIIRIPAREKRTVQKVKKVGFVDFDDSDDSDDDDEKDQLANDDPDYIETDETEERETKKKRIRSGKDLGHRRDDDSVPPSTARYLASFPAPTPSGYASSGSLSDREAAALSAMAAASSTSSHLGSPSSYFSTAANSSASMQVDHTQDTEPGWEVKSRTPLGSRSLSQASSRSNTPPPPSSRRIRADRPGLRRENSGIHPNAFIVGLPVDFETILHPNSSDSAELNAGTSQSADAITAGKTQVVDLGRSSSSDSSSDSSSEEEDELDTDEDELVLGIISPEKPRVASSMEPVDGEGSLMDETWPELEKMPCSPEDVLIPRQEQLDGFVEHSTGENAVARSGNREAASDLDASKSHSNEQGTLSTPALPPPSPSQRRRMLLADETLDDNAAEEAEAAAGAAAARRLRDSLQMDMATDSVPEVDVGYVRRLLEQCEMVVHPSTASYERDPLPLAVPKRKMKRSDDGGTAPPPSPNSESVTKTESTHTKAISGLLRTLSAEITRPSSIEFIKSPKASEMGEAASDSFKVPKVPAKPTSTSAPQHRKVTAVYPSKRAKPTSQNKLLFKEQDRRNGTSKSASQASSPYRKSTEKIRDQVGINHFLDSMYTSEDDAEEDLMDLPPPLASGQVSAGNSQGATFKKSAYAEPATSSSTSSSNGSAQVYKKPLTPSKPVKQKRYPGMLVSPDPPESIKATREEEEADPFAGAQTEHLKESGSLAETAMETLPHASEVLPRITLGTPALT